MACGGAIPHLQRPFHERRDRLPGMWYNTIDVGELVVCGVAIDRLFFMFKWDRFCAFRA